MTTKSSSLPSWLTPWASRPLGPGTVMRGRGTYRLIRLLGRGGMGEVWLADKGGSNGFSKLVAIKAIRRSKLADPRVRTMFLDEARLVANLVHPNIVQVYQLIENRSTVYIVMEHVFGVTLLRIMERLAEAEREFPVDVGVHIIARALRGLYYAHCKRNREGRHLQIVHRDICPSNLLISFRGIPKIGDFGVAKATISDVDDELDTVWGKYPYMAPEAVRREGTESRSDLYSMGLVLYEMFTGKLLHNVGDTSALTHHLEGEESEDRDIRTHAPHLPQALADIIIRATAHDPKERFADAKAFAETLEQFLLTHWMFPDEERVADFLASLFPQAEKHRWW